ncbi:unnamed protein product [Adineta ricciae]|uniref:C2H2-type domain-containing protein n=1 Tax=Adineta ricciae TaxID=249248 RepID=A0A815TZW7_ADIRI|nr:unnamed protein product [Adineta ricciae]
MASFICPSCVTTRNFDNLAKIFRHVTVYHQNDPNFNLTCDLHRTCGVLYKTYSAYKAHIYRQHSAQLYSTTNNSSSRNNIDFLVDNRAQEHANSPTNLETFNHFPANDEDEDEDTSDFLYDEAESTVEINEYIPTFSFSTSNFNSANNDGKNLASILDMKRSYISFILYLREEYLLPKKITQAISDYIVSLIEHIQLLFEEKASFYYADTNAFPETFTQRKKTKAVDCDLLKNILSDIGESIKCISKNEYQLVKTCQEYFGYTSPEEVILSSAGENIERGYIIPLEKTLSLMLNSQPLLAQILQNVQQQRVSTDMDDDLMFSIRDAYHGKKLDEETLLIQLYLDDISLTNPLGSKRDKHKMCMLYFSLEDIPYQYRSKLDFVHLVGICESRILKDTTKAKRFLQPVIDNLNQLQLHELVVNGNHLKFSFSTIVADNLAAHMVGGFQTCFSNGFFCRRCYITYADKNLPIPLTQIKSRMINDHDGLVHELIHNPNKSPLMGVVGPSLFDDLIGFHATTSLSADCMHDFLEGVCPIVIMCLLKEASSMRLLTYVEIEKRMVNFNYGHFDKSNQPPPIQVKHLQNDRIVATAAEKLCMFKLFPILFYDIIHHLSGFIVYKILREILDLTLSLPFRKQWLPVLADLCETFHLKMLACFPDKMIPKVHFVRESQQIIHDYGPPIKNWCFRYEASHYYFKKIMMRSNNFKNVPKTLATRYCLKQHFKSDYLYQLKDFIYPISIKKARTTCFSMAMKKLLANELGWDELDESVLHCLRLVCDTSEYCRSAVYVVDLLHFNEQPVFAQIVFIVKVEEKWWLLVDLLETVAYNEEYFAWEIKSSDRYSIIDPCRLKYYYKGLDIYEVNHSSFVSFTARLTPYE